MSIADLKDQWLVPHAQSGCIDCMFACFSCGTHKCFPTSFTGKFKVDESGTLKLVDNRCACILHNDWHAVRMPAGSAFSQSSLNTGRPLHAYFAPHHENSHCHPIWLRTGYISRTQDTSHALPPCAILVSRLRSLLLPPSVAHSVLQWMRRRAVRPGTGLQERDRNQVGGHGRLDSCRWLLRLSLIHI